MLSKSIVNMELELLHQERDISAIYIVSKINKGNLISVIRNIY